MAAYSINLVSPSTRQTIVYQDEASAPSYPVRHRTKATNAMPSLTCPCHLPCSFYVLLANCLSVILVNIAACDNHRWQTKSILNN